MYSQIYKIYKINVNCKMYEQYPKDGRRVTEVYCYKIMILYVNWHNINSRKTVIN